MRHRIVTFVSCLALACSARAGLIFSTGGTDGLIGMASRPGPATGANQETEAADDFILSAPTAITSATFLGLLPAGSTAASVSQIVIEMYRVFPNDSNVGGTSGPPTFSTPKVPTRVNSPSDVELDGRDSSLGELTFGASDLGAFSLPNSVDIGINPKPNQGTGGDGPVRGEEFLFNITFNSPFVLPPDHYFFVPQVLLVNPNQHFLWLSAARPIVGGTGPFAPDLQAWIRNDNLSPDWLRVGTDIVGAGTFNGAFSLDGTVVPEPGTMGLFAAMAAGITCLARGRRRAPK